MFTATIIGTGNLAWHLAGAFARSEKIELAQVVGRNSVSLSTFSRFSPITSSISSLEQTDLVVIAVSDDAVGAVSRSFPPVQSLIVHTSGSVPLEILGHFRNNGVLYPLQTFTKERQLDLSTVPFCIEANSEENRNVLRNFASAISNKVVDMSSSQRSSLHLSAVMASNFCNHLLTLTHSFCRKENVPFELLENLMKETIAKAFELGPAEAQTGPAHRGDYSTLNKQMEILKKNHLYETYKQLTNSILKTYGKAEL